MSADNVIYIQKIGRYWWCWHTSASATAPYPSRKDSFFGTKYDAMEYACDMMTEMGYVEYGIQFLEEKNTGNP